MNLVGAIPLTKGRVAIVDLEDFELVSRHQWTFHPTRNGRGYAVRNTGPRGNRIWKRMHRELFGLPTGSAGCELVVDHRNNIGLDNRRANLEPVTRRENNVRARSKEDPFL